MPANSRDELRRGNVSALLSRVHVNGPTSRAALTAELGLNRSTIGDITGQLESLGLVTEELPATPTGSGRPSHLVVPRPDVTVLAVALDVDRIVIAQVGLGGVVLERCERAHRRGAHDLDTVVASVSTLCRTLLANTPQARCLGIGVSVPGAVRDHDGLIRFAPNLGWVDQPFGALLSSELQLPVRTGNDANLGVLAEHLRGAAVGMDDCAYLSGSVGIGGGFLVGGVRLSGAGGYAGEIGHLVVDSNGAPCQCGAAGCWETRVGENHLLQSAGRRAGGGAAAVSEVLAAAAAGEPRARDALAEHARWTGAGLSAIATIFNPSMIVLGGVLAQVWDAGEEAITSVLQAGNLLARSESMSVVPAGLGADSSLIGAAEVAFAPLLADPLALATAA
jgi:predicted NBD/HSP70 family sugar kinase